MRLIDTHAHLDASDFRTDREAVISRAFSAGIGIITVGTDLLSSNDAVRLARRYRLVWAAVGVHPHDAKTVEAKGLASLQRLARLEQVVAVGEIGLDYYRDLSPRLVQRRVFQEQLAIASGLDLPIIVHNRDSTLDLLHILHQEGSAYRGVIHSFLGDSELAAKFLSLGFHLGIGGPITFSKSGGLREAVERIPIERLLLETDCPYLAPSPHRGKRNEPTYLHFVVEKVAEIKGVSVENVRKRTTENAVNLFSLSA